MSEAGSDDSNIGEVDISETESEDETSVASIIEESSSDEGENTPELDWNYDYSVATDASLAATSCSPIENGSEYPSGVAFARPSPVVDEEGREETPLEDRMWQDRLGCTAEEDSATAQLLGPIVDWLEQSSGYETGGTIDPCDTLLGSMQIS